MIYTVTLNPSLDYVAFCDTFNFGKTNRTRNEYFVPGGKGLNISILLSRLGDDTCALGFTGGFTGKELTRLLNKEGINCDFQDVAQSTRINIKLSCNKITEFNASGITLDNNKINALKEKLKTLKSGDWLCLCGSLPNGVNASIYHDLALCVPQGVNVVIDTIGKPLLQALKVKPFLIKPNIDELCDIFECEIKTQEEIIFYAKKLKDMGAKNVLISLGKDGALLLDSENKIHIKKPPKGNAVNTVAAGDSMIAGFIHKFIKTKNYKESLKFATACGSATAFSEWIASPTLIEKLYKTL